MKYKVEVEAVGTTNGAVPFWMRSNQYGSIPMAGPSTSLVGRAARDYDLNGDTSGKSKRWDWGMGIEGRINSNFRHTEFIPTEGYLKGRLRFLELRIGRSKETMGITGDTMLTSGSFAISGNTLGIPKIDIAIPEYESIPLWGGVLSIKGSLAHGWIGSLPLKETPDRNVLKAKTYFHQKSLYGRLGKSGDRLKVSAGFSHQAFWGHEKSFNPPSYNLGTFETFTHVLLGKPFGTEDIPRSKIGNHLGTIDFQINYCFRPIELTLYRQSFYDVGALFRLANLRDGLHGIQIINRESTASSFRWKTLLVEYLATKNQAGEIWSKITRSGDEDYYNNFIYKNGWSYKDIGLGTPFISTRGAIRKNLVTSPVDFFVNNRIYMVHIGGSVQFGAWSYLGKISYSDNRGTFATTEGRSRGSEREPAPPKRFERQKQTSVLFTGERMLKSNFKIGFTFVLDRGGLLYNSEGTIITFSKIL